ncbi:MAG: C_GCAxxG_C_C family protein [Deltaproteobacteria bacterium]|nr:C_GCAxxG_C_C family protein [Deltaproteobacteria bacterium]
MQEKTDRDSLLDRIEKEAHNYEKDFHGCSRCVLKPLQTHLNLGDVATLKASTPLAAGVAMRGETCGAFLGGLLAVGIATASSDIKDTDALTNSLASGFRFARIVEKELGSTNCTTIQTDKLGRYYNIADPEQYEAFIKAGGYVSCSKVVGKIARLAAQFILDYQERKRT